MDSQPDDASRPTIREIPVVPRSGRAFAQLVGIEEFSRYEEGLARARQCLDGRTLWHVNSTADGGGVAELLRSCLGYLQDSRIATRWLVVEGDSHFFDITKRIHNRLHGDPGDGGPLGDVERQRYDQISRRNLEFATEFIRKGDVVILHDPQPLGLLPGLVAHGATVIWTCHVGSDTPDEVARSAWDFLRGYLDTAHALTFTRRAYVWEGLDDARIALIPPCIDGLALKNCDLTPDQRDAILGAAHVCDTSVGGGRPTFVRGDSTLGRITHRAAVVEDSPVPADAKLVVQISRWDRLKDPTGVLRGFAATPDPPEAHLMLAGPAPWSVRDDPEGVQVFREIHDEWRGLPRHVRCRVHLANLPVDDVDENALVVNALQRRADVIVQKSLAEGFGLTVTEAMWKARPVVASRVGGIQDQIEDGTNGLLVHPGDLTAFGNAVRTLLDQPERAALMAAAGRQRVRERYLVPHYLGSYLQLIARLRT